MNQGCLSVSSMSRKRWERAPNSLAGNEASTKIGRNKHLILCAHNYVSTIFYHSFTLMHLLSYPVCQHLARYTNIHSLNRLTHHMIQLKVRDILIGIFLQVHSHAQVGIHWWSENGSSRGAIHVAIAAMVDGGLMLLHAIPKRWGCWLMVSFLTLATHGMRGVAVWLRWNVAQDSTAAMTKLAQLSATWRFQNADLVLAYATRPRRWGASGCTVLWKTLKFYLPCAICRLACIGLYWPSTLNSLSWEWVLSFLLTTMAVSCCIPLFRANQLIGRTQDVVKPTLLTALGLFSLASGLHRSEIPRESFDIVWPFLTVFDYANAIVQDSFTVAQNHRRSWGESHSPHAQKIEARLGAVLVMHS